MSSVSLPAEAVPGFKTKLTTKDKECALECSGALDGPDSTSLLQPQLIRLHEALQAERFTRVRLDLSQVTYMNSSATKCFMAWFLKAERSKDTSYTIDVVFDPGTTWQYVSFTTMGRIAPRILKMVALPKAS